MTETHSGAQTAHESGGGKRTGNGNVFARLGLFLRQVMSELRKVIWPGRSDLIQYTLVVIVFVAVLIGIVALLDLAFAKGVLAVFG